jgi:hypothetical protein
MPIQVIKGTRCSYFFLADRIGQPSAGEPDATRSQRLSALQDERQDQKNQSGQLQVRSKIWRKTHRHWSDVKNAMRHAAIAPIRRSERRDCNLHQPLCFTQATKERIIVGLIDSITQIEEWDQLPCYVKGCISWTQGFHPIILED